MIIEITIPEKVSMNKVKGMNHFVWYRLAELFHSEFADIKGKLKVEKYPVQIQYDWHWTKKPLDSLNSALMCKLLEDGMVKAGILEDDGVEYVRRSILDSKVSDAYKHDTVVITIESL